MNPADAEAPGASAASALRMARLSFQAEQAQQLVPLELLQQARQHIKVRAPNPPAPKRREGIDDSFWRGFEGVYNRVEREKLARQLLVGEQPALQDASQAISPLRYERNMRRMWFRVCSSHCDLGEQLAKLEPAEQEAGH